MGTILKNIKYGSVEVSIWRNERENNLFNFSITMKKNYKGSDGLWKDSTILNKKDLLDASLCYQKAYEWLSNYKSESNHNLLNKMENN